MGDTPKPELSVIVPAYREADQLGASLSELAEFLSGCGYASEVVVVDDGSDDGTADVAAECIADWPDGSELRVLRHEHNRGKGAAVRTGMLASSGAYAVFTDADLAYGTEPIGRVMAALASGADLVCGRRDRHLGLARRVAGYLFARLAQALGLATTDDPQCGLKGFSSEAASLVFGLVTVDGFAFDVEALHVAALNGLDVRYVPVSMRRSGKTSVNVVRDAGRMLRSLWEIRRSSRAGRYATPAALR